MVVFIANDIDTKIMCDGQKSSEIDVLKGKKIKASKFYVNTHEL